MTAFTTEPEHARKTSINIVRKGSVVRERCRQLSQIALELNPNRRITEEDLAYLIQRHIGGDKETVRAYIGYFGHIKRSRRTGEGYTVGLSRKGYLDRFDFMHRANDRTWIIHAQVKLSTAPIVYQDNEGCQMPKEKISISFTKWQVERNEQTERLQRDGGEVGKKEEEDTERDRNFTPKIFRRLTHGAPEGKFHFEEG